MFVVQSSQLVLRTCSNIHHPSSLCFHKYNCRTMNVNLTTSLLKPLPPLLIKLPAAYGKNKTFISTTTTTTALQAAYKDYHLADAGNSVAAPPSSDLNQLHGGGIGILKFLRGKNYFVTGATGFLAKVLIEKLLRTAPDVGKIFLLIRAKDQEAAVKRLKLEIIDSEIFKSLEKLHGKSYKTFMLNKLVAVAGDVCTSELGIESNLAIQIAQVVDVIVNSSANTTFDERYDVSINTNTKGPCRVLSFAKKCKNLSLFLHVSTAYVNGERGIIPEMPIQMGRRMINENLSDEVDVETEISIALQSNESFQSTSTQFMKELGMLRAKQHGWINTYALAKAMGEMMIYKDRDDIPVVIIRPSAIESTYQDPFPGWIEGNRMMDPVLLSYGKGQLPGFLANPNAVMDVVPVDMVVNTILVAMARHGRESKSEVNVYHAASSVSNPITLGDIFKYTLDHFTSSPLMDEDGNQIRIKEMKYLSSMADFSSYISTEIVKRHGLTDSAMSNGKLLQRLKTKRQKLETIFLYLAKIYEPYGFCTSWFDNAKVRELINMMSLEEKKLFECDVGIVDWKEYICNIHLPGFRKYVLKGK